jgi:type IV secretory pathway ATPase VirB11/archaellum biosynthesis ATPase
MSIIELIRAGNMDHRMAAMLWVAMERGASLIVAADPPHSGKTTTLSALMAFTHPDTFVYFTCGQGETFQLPKIADGLHTYILINEMSDHIPVYTWDDNARRAFELLAQGYRIGTTMHADTVAGVIEQLETDLAIPKAHVRNLTFIMPLFIGRTGNGTVRRVVEIAFIQPDGDSAYGMTSVARWDPGTDSFRMFAEPGGREALAAWAGLSPEDLDREINKRESFLKQLDEKDLYEIPAVIEAVEQYYERVIMRG